MFAMIVLIVLMVVAVVATELVTRCSPDGKDCAEAPLGVEPTVEIAGD
ncbi:hypothetical protein [Nonomuraea rhodomycinica]|uniref:Uncharacterized protein n=1 Tax=Nonomuraea rhodomycinica TaxID=1712872 RepID=A0A7Y6ME10_9ACTN|nr:hypothetical protein [Nonomuraea rhodomycinica]NUW43520.1 hypothetical protein [Nonomuraea rhodomycinica]